MEFRGKAYFNFLRKQAEGDLSLSAKQWQTEDYRKLSDEDLFSRLKNLGIKLEADALKRYVQQAESPEDLVNILKIKNQGRQDQAFLLVFELWRRHFPEKVPLCIFCDEIDQIIEQYYLGQSIDIDRLYEYLKQLEKILDEQVDHGIDPKETFKYVSSYFAYDLEKFIYTCIADQIKQGNDTFASEMLDWFYEYVQRPRWFDFLRIQLVALTDVDAAYLMLSRFLQEFAENPDVELGFKVLPYLLETGHFSLFEALAPTIANLITIEEQFQEYRNIMDEYTKIIGKKAFLE